MSTNIYVGNLAFSTSTSDLERLFAEYGTVTRAQVVEDRETGRSRGFGFVEMSSSDEAQKAISTLDGAEVDGRNLKVNVAKERSR
ncbi:MAG: RNA-binding protein [Acidimicrobiia bacterium]|nr:RNA-binding protein [Acidimicrobiia bacterium]MBT8192433.1 RNA-binding protein [Acidimicrobiia bacterium]MBT8246676.1 RNA-binding protein [Acidimicrobiia bacterium]NNF87299.1 RNA-binding protein [Acidimicrobiia bacterium]NNJ48323.1 RNA-binding protein [Acidimicrobiia bacterium]